ncbi:uncharacterized protein B0J16DRAFT_323650 [Fusarium flagelliforme]|uniref:uncharacterized protein n=1 Tax=Fusarium flagelliforme TaxID=2675880 RepID=UPI001E8E43BC|nr:uncharacterized protein B0J16DRAFT_323650 [Fusarium flagelliforme]KAH7174183.1 hypothetical protein B0J16DRAFT_323650 [Fusarium flagelliforme]
MPIVVSYRNTELLPYLRPLISYVVWNHHNFAALGTRRGIGVPSVNESSVDPHIASTWHSYPFDIEATWKVNSHISWTRCYVLPAKQGRQELTMIGLNETDISVMFTTKGTPKQIDLVVATSKNCSSLVGATINVTDTMRTPSYFTFYDKDVCPMVVSPPIESDSCGTTLDATVVSDMEASMTSWVCNEVPEIFRPKQVNCSSPEEEEITAQQNVAGGATYLTFVVGALLFI